VKDHEQDQGEARGCVHAIYGADLWDMKLGYRRTKLDPSGKSITDE